MTGVSHNGIFRGKNLGSISTLNEYIAFRSAHGIDDYSYKDLYLGDYFTVNDGTYNAVWMVAHFDYFYRKGQGQPSQAFPDRAGEGVRGVVLIPRTNTALGEIQMNTTDTTEGGYKASLANTTHCPAVAAAMQTVFGSYLLNMPTVITDTVDTNTASMAGAGWTGATTGASWTAQYCIIPNECQIYGTTVDSSSRYDSLAYPQQLSIFNFISHVEYHRQIFWLRTVTNAVRFAYATSNGTAGAGAASVSNGFRPIIYIG